MVRLAPCATCCVVLLALVTLSLAVHPKTSIDSNAQMIGVDPDLEESLMDQMKAKMAEAKEKAKDIKKKVEGVVQSATKKVQETLGVGKKDEPASDGTKKLESNQPQLLEEGKENWHWDGSFEVLKTDMADHTAEKVQHFSHKDIELMHRHDFSFGMHDLLVIVDAQEEHTTNLNLLQDPGIRQVMQGIADLVTEFLRNGGEVVVSAQLNRPRSCGFFSAKKFQYLWDAKTPPTDPVELAKQKGSQSEGREMYEYYFGPLQEKGCGAEFSSNQICSKPYLHKNNENVGKDPGPNEGGGDPYVQGKKAVRLWPNHKRYLADMFFSQDDRASDPTGACNPPRYTPPMQVMAPEGGAALDSFLFRHIDNLSAKEKEHVFVALKGYNDPAEGWLSSVAAFDVKAEEEDKDKDKGKAKDKDEDTDEAVGPKPKALCQWDIGRRFINPFDRSWLEVTNPDAEKWMEFFMAPTHKNRQERFYPQECADNSFTIEQLVHGDNPKGADAMPRANRIFVVGFPYETAVLDTTTALLKVVQGGMQSVTVLGDYVRMLWPMKPSEAEASRAMFSHPERLIPRSSAEQGVRQLQCLTANVNLPHPFFSGVDIRFWEPVLKSVFTPISVSKNPEEISRARVAIQGAVLGLPDSEQDRGDKPSLTSTCTTETDEINAKILSLSDEAVMAIDNSQDAQISFEELSDFLFMQLGELLHKCWLRPNMGKGKGFCSEYFATE